MKLTIDIFMYLFEYMIFMYYAESLFKGIKTKCFRVLIGFCLYGLLFAIYQFGSTVINLVSFFILTTLVIKFVYNSNLKKSIFHSAVLETIMFASEMITAVINDILFKSFNAFENDMTAYLFSIVVSKLSYFILVMFVLRFFIKKHNVKIKNIYYAYLFIMPISTLALMCSLRYIGYKVELDPQSRNIWMASFLLLLMSNLIVFLVYEYSDRATRELYELRSLKREEERDKQYFGLIEQTNNEVRAFAHDTKNHLLTIREIDDDKKRKEYIDKLLGNIEDFSYKNISKNKTLDIILGKYTSLCQNSNIKFSVDVKTANLSFVDDVDLSVLMNNLLDNSIESAEKSKEKIISFSIFDKGKKFETVIIKNSCDIKPSVKNGILQTTKRGQALHGIGTKNINKIVDKYNAFYNWKYDEENHVFETCIIFSKD